MLQLYYKAAMGVGLAITTGTAVAFLLLNHNLYSALFTLSAMIFGMRLSATCYDFFQLKLWSGIYALIMCYGAFLVLYWQGESFSYVGFCLIGLTLPGFLVTLPGNLTINWFGSLKAPVLGIIWSISIATGLLLRIAISIFSYKLLLLWFPLLVSCCLFLLQKFPVNYLDGHKKSGTLNSGKKAGAIIFFFCTTICSSLVLRLLFDANDTTASGSFSILFFGGLLLFPLLFSFFIDRKGAFSGCVLVIFLSECSILAEVLYDLSALQRLVPFLAGAVATAPTVLCPLLTYYLFGPGGYNKRLSHISLSIPSAYFVSFLIPLEKGGPTFAVYLIIGMLLFSFAAVFSAWRHRLVLLKSS